MSFLQLWAAEKPKQHAGMMQKIWNQKTPLCQALICISTGTLVPSLLWHFLRQFFLFNFVLSENDWKTI